MGNSISNNFEKYQNSHYTSLDDNEIKNIRSNYKVIYVDWLDTILINDKIFDDDYFIKSPQKKCVINNMMEFYLNHKDENDKEIYKKTDYLCNEKEKVCICNTHADDFRKIYDGVNYKRNTTYISWCKKYNDKF
jgi:hypothetical protein